MNNDAWLKYKIINCIFKHAQQVLLRLYNSLWNVPTSKKCAWLHSPLKIMFKIKTKQ